MKKVLRCECGTEIASADDDELVALGVSHAWRVHRMRIGGSTVVASAEPVVSSADHDHEEGNG